LIRCAAGGKRPWKDQGLVIEYDRDLGFSMTGTDEGPVARFGWAPFHAKYERLVEALDWARGKSIAISRVLLDNTRRPNAVTLKTGPSAGLASLSDGRGKEIVFKGLEDDHE
ncbi:MAG: hypothetical protein GXP54_10510, partial [Deltaproteobacteria bacterium]|nr:hypothetical protein [Deltaproteobacteria bacterium]